MVRTIVVIIVIIFVLVAVALLYLQLRTVRAERDVRQQAFVGGQPPNPLPDGFYKGRVSGYNGGWVGKKFNLAEQTGINQFKDGQEAYPFITSSGSGLRDKNLTVLKIDYNIKANPFWLRLILDEIVETSPGHFLGKLNIRFGGLAFTVGYFSLEK